MQYFHLGMLLHPRYWALWRFSRVSGECSNYVHRPTIGLRAPHCCLHSRQFAFVTLFLEIQVLTIAMSHIVHSSC